MSHSFLTHFPYAFRQEYGSRQGVAGLGFCMRSYPGGTWTQWPCGGVSWPRD